MTRHLAPRGRCRYHNLPIRKIINDETSIKVNVGIGTVVDVRYADRLNTNKAF